MDDTVFAPGTPEVEIDRRSGLPVAMEGEKGRMGEVVLTNDRILMGDRVQGTGTLVGEIAAAAVEAGVQRKAGGPGPHELVRLSDVRGARMQRRRLIPDLYELTLADGRTCRLHRSLRRHWDTDIRRLVAQRHGLAVTEDAEGWRAAPS